MQKRVCVLAGLLVFSIFLISSVSSDSSQQNPVSATIPSVNIVGCTQYDNGMVYNSSFNFSAPNEGLNFNMSAYIKVLYANGNVDYFNNTCIPDLTNPTDLDKGHTIAFYCSTEGNQTSYNSVDSEVIDCDMPCKNFSESDMYVNTTKSGYFEANGENVVEVYTHLPEFMSCEEHFISPSGLDINTGIGGCEQDNISYDVSFPLYNNGVWLLEYGNWKAKIIAWDGYNDCKNYTIISPPFNFEKAGLFRKMTSWFKRLFGGQ